MKSVQIGGVGLILPGTAENAKKSKKEFQNAPYILICMRWKVGYKKFDLCLGWGYM